MWWETGAVLGVEIGLFLVIFVLFAISRTDRRRSEIFFFVAILISKRALNSSSRRWVEGVLSWECGNPVQRLVGCR